MVIAAIAEEVANTAIMAARIAEAPKEAEEVTVAGTCLFLILIDHIPPNAVPFPIAYADLILPVGGEGVD